MSRAALSRYGVCITVSLTEALVSLTAADDFVTICEPGALFRENRSRAALGPSPFHVHASQKAIDGPVLAPLEYDIVGFGVHDDLVAFRLDPRQVVFGSIKRTAPPPNPALCR